VDLFAVGVDVDVDESWLEKLVLIQICCMNDAHA
jgi:hypothetical protein